MKVRMVKGLAVVLCAAMLAPAAGAAGAVMMPGMVVEATGNKNPATENNENGTNQKTDDQLAEEARKNAEGRLKDHQLMIDPDGKYTEKLNKIISDAINIVNGMKTADKINSYLNQIETRMNDAVNPQPDDDEEEEDPIPVSADHLR